MPAQAQAAAGMGRTRSFVYEKTVVRSTAGTRP